MSDLARLQRSFAQALSDPTAALPEAVSAQDTQHREKRFNIYRNNVFASLIEVLAGRYPAVQKLVGEEFFTATASAFIRAHPPRDPVMILYGHDFPRFLENFEPAATLPYLGDVARIERAWNTAYYAAEARPLGPQDFAAVAAEDVARLALSLHPSVALLTSPFPARSIWQANLDGDDLSGLNLCAGGEDTAIVRPLSNVKAVTLPPGAYIFLKALQHGQVLGQAVDAAMTSEPAFDFQANLTGLISNGMITGFAVKPS